MEQITRGTIQPHRTGLSQALVLNMQEQTPASFFLQKRAGSAVREGQSKDSTGVQSCMVWAIQLVGSQGLQSTQKSKRLLCAGCAGGMQGNL